MAAFLTKLSSKNNSLPVTFELPTSFVDWPNGERVHLLQEEEVKLPLTEALDALFGRRAAVGVSPPRGDLFKNCKEAIMAHLKFAWVQLLHVPP